MPEELIKIALKGGDISASKSNLQKHSAGSKSNLSKSNLLGSKGNLYSSRKNLAGSNVSLSRALSNAKMNVTAAESSLSTTSNAIIYENTYKLKPDVKFGAGKVTEIIKTTLQKMLLKQKYDAEKAADLITSITNEILAEVKKLGYERYKIVVQLDLGEFKGQGIKVASRCVWDTTTDTWASGSFKNVLTSFDVGLFVRGLHGFWTVL